MIKNKNKKTTTDTEIRKLVIARLQTLSSNKKLSIGSEGEFSKDELIESVNKDNEIGQK